MEWERAKNYILIMFILLNIGLAFLWFGEYNRYTMTAEQERMINSILSQNNISMYIRPVRRSPPKSPLHVTGFYYNEEKLLDLFFENPDNIINDSSEFYRLFRCMHSQLVISNGFVAFNTIKPLGFRNTGEFFIQNPQELNLQSATALTAPFIESYFPEFRQDSSFYDGGIHITYRQAYRGRIIHSNFIEFLVTQNGIQRIEMQFGQVIGHGGTPQMIFAPDEALLTFTQFIRHRSQYSPIIITYMDLAYFKDYDFISDQPGTVPYFAMPFYRIFIQGDDRPFLINAFTNVLVN